MITLEKECRVKVEPKGGVICCQRTEKVPTIKKVLRG